MDATYVGGKAAGKGSGYLGNKTIVAGAVERAGRVRLERIPDVRRKTLHGFTSRTVRDEAEAIYTDELASYLGIGDDVGSFHKVSSKHIDRSPSELEWRYNNRKNDHIFVDTLSRIVKTDELTYRTLVA